MSALELALDRKFLISCFVVLFLILFQVLHVLDVFCVCVFAHYFGNRVPWLSNLCHLAFKEVSDWYYPIDYISGLWLC